MAFILQTVTVPTKRSGHTWRLCTTRREEYALHAERSINYTKRGVCTTHREERVCSTYTEEYAALHAESREYALHTESIHYTQREGSMHYT